MVGAGLWLLTGRNAGDAAQLAALAAAAGLPARDVPLRHSLLREAPAAWLGPSLASLSGDPGLSPPWPAAVLGAGRRAVPAARWIARASGGATRLVWVGRPRAPAAWFDLILTTPQYGLASAPNVLRLTLPFVAEPPPGAGRRLVAALGGPAWGARLGAAEVDAFAAAAKRLAAETGLAPCLTTSRRSPAGAAARLRAQLPGWEVHDGAAGGPNPYRGWLAEAGACLVSGDSVSMLADAGLTGATVWVMPLPHPRWLAALRATAPGRRWAADGGRALLAPPPDPAAVHAALTEAGLARRDGALLRVDGARPFLLAERAGAVARLRATLEAAAVA